MTTRRLLVIDDDPEVRGYVAAIAESCGFVAVEAECFGSLCSTLDDSDPAGIVLDLSLPDADGIEALRYLGSRGFEAPVIIASSFDERVLATTRRLGESFGLKMVGQLRKPFAPRDLRDLFATFPNTTSPIGANDLRAALDNGHVGLAYQPKVNLDSGVLMGAEALARWHDPERGTIGPDQFIGLAEAHGLMPTMLDHVLARAIGDCRTWNCAGIDVPVAVNLSAALLGDLSIPDRIAAATRTAGLDPSSLILEVTESMAMRDPMASMGVLTRLRIKGFRIALDDFGVGYSSLVELHRMPFSELKIDRSFIAQIEADRDARVIVRAIVGLGEALDLTVVAEGVETEAQRVILRELGCHVAQGYLFSRPVPNEQFVAWVHARTGAVATSGEATLRHAAKAVSG